MHNILANPGVLFVTAGLIGLTVLGVGYGLLTLAVRRGWLK